MSQPNIQCPNGCGKLRADLREDDECIWRDMVCDGCGYVFGLESIPNPKAFKWTERNMQDALTARGNLFDWTRYAVIPNVTAFSVFEHGEADLLCLSKSNTLHEVEIKVSASDLMADSKKGPYAHHNRLVSYVWFAVPESLIPVALSNLDERFGIVAVHHKIHSLGSCSRAFILRSSVGRRKTICNGIASRTAMRLCGYCELVLIACGHEEQELRHDKVFS